MTEASQLLLANLSRYTEISPEEATRTVAAFTLEDFPRKSVLVQSGETANHIYFVVKGCLRLYRSSDNGHVHVLQFSTEDWWAVDLHSFVYGIPSRLCLDALEHTQVMKISKPDYDQLLAEIPVLERAFRIMAQRGMASMQQRIVDALSQSALQRYLAFREQYGHLEGRLPQRQIAAFIGVTPEFLSALRGKLARGEAM